MLCHYNVNNHAVHMSTWCTVFPHRNFSFLSTISLKDYYLYGHYIRIHLCVLQIMFTPTDVTFYIAFSKVVGSGICWNQVVSDLTLIRAGWFSGNHSSTKKIRNRIRISCQWMTEYSGCSCDTENLLRLLSPSFSSRFCHHLVLLHFNSSHNWSVLEVRTVTATESRLIIIQLSGTSYSRRSSGTNEVSNSGNRPRDADTTVVTCHIRYCTLTDGHYDQSCTRFNYSKIND